MSEFEKNENGENTSMYSNPANGEQMQAQAEQDFMPRNERSEKENFTNNPANGGTPNEQHTYSYANGAKEDLRNYEPVKNDPPVFTYSYTSNGTKENVTGRYQTMQNPGTQNVNGQTYAPYAPRETYATGNNPGSTSAPFGNDPYNGNSSYTAPSYTPSYNTAARNGSRKKAKNKAPYVKTSTMVLLCIACVILSFAISILGAALVVKATESENGGISQSGGDNTVVMYREVETKHEGPTNVSDIVDTVADSVVEITTEFVTNNNYFFGQYISQGAGSGVIVSDDGYIVTNNHVICNTENSNKQADTITVRLRNGTDYKAKVIGTDSDADIALIKIDATDLKAAVWGNSDDVLVGQQVVAVGNPLGSLGGTLTVGYISAKSREIEIDNVKMTLIQTDAAVNPGNSGGGLFDLNGNLIGIVNAKSSGTGVEGLGFAIPANDAKDTVEQLLEYGYVKGKVFIGVSFYEYNSGFYSSFGSSGMLMVYGVEKGFNDDVLKPGDIVLSVDNKEVSTVADVRAALKGHKVGDKLTFSILRNKTPIDVEVKCYEYNPQDSTVSFEP